MDHDSTDAFHYRAAQGWLELGSWQEANAELEELTPRNRAHPQVLKMRVEIYSAAKRWEEAAIIAEGLVKLAAIDAPDLEPLWEGQRGTMWKRAD